MIDQSSIQALDPFRADIAAMTARFAAAGGSITVLSHIERAPDKPLAYNTSITRRHNARREYLALEQKIAEHGKALAATGLTSDEAARQLRQRWGIGARITAQKAEQIAAKYGYAYAAGKGE